jgi:hypothetical protein
MGDFAVNDLRGHRRIDLGVHYLVENTLFIYDPEELCPHLPRTREVQSYL